MANKSRKKEYVPLKGFYDLREFELTEKQFNQFYRIQKFLFGVENERLSGKIHPQIEKIRDLSGQYQQCLFSYAKKHISKDALKLIKGTT